MLVSPACNPPSGKRPSSVHEVVWQCSRSVVILNVVDVAKPDGAAGVIFHERQGLANIKSSRSILQENFSKNKNKGIPAYLRLDYRTRGQSGKRDLD